MVSLECVASELPEFGPEDITVCHRQHEKCAWLTEVWTHRAFAAGELLIAPVTTEIKDVHWTRTASAMITTPLAGQGAHPEGKTLAFGGRGRTSVMSRNCGGRMGRGSEGAKHGSLFWVIPREQTTAESNLRLETVAMGLVGSFKFPNCEKKRKVQYLEKDVPQVPVMVNPKAIEAHVPLVCLEDKKFMNIKQTSPVKT